MTSKRERATSAPPVKRKRERDEARSKRRRAKARIFL
jgi:hypothetical protein